MTSGETREPLVFRASRYKNLGFVALMLVLALAGYSRSHRDPSVPNLGLLFSGALCIVAVVFLVKTICYPPRLTLSRNGIEHATGTSSTPYDWWDIEALAIRNTHGMEYIVMQMRESYAGHNKVQMILNQFSSPTHEIIESPETWRRIYAKP